MNDMTMERVVRAFHDLMNYCMQNGGGVELPPEPPEGGAGGTLESEDVLVAFRRYADSYQKRDTSTVRAAVKWFARYMKGESVRLSCVDYRLCRGFRDYLQGALHGSTPAGYFKKFKQFLTSEVEEGRLAVNPATPVRVVTSDGFCKEVLDAGELRALARTPCSRDVVKWAFLFCCQTGLRWCDVGQLQRSNIDTERRRMKLLQRKVKGHSRRDLLNVALGDNALWVLRQTGFDSADTTPENAAQRLFPLPSYTYSLRVLQKWVAQAGIRKHITFHCARHSFVTNLIAAGVHLSTVAALAGHSTTRHTERYVHLVDTQMVEALRCLPLIEAEEDEPPRGKAGGESR